MAPSPPFPPLPRLPAGSVSLRPWRRRDAAAFAAATHDREIVRWTAMPEGLDEAAAAEWLAGLQERVEAGAVAPFAIADAQDRAVGGIGLVNFDERSGSAEVFYWLAAEARGRGLATAALRRISGWAFDALGLARLELTTLPGNAASQRVAERAGFRREGVLRSKRPIRGVRHDLVLFSLLPGEPTIAEAAATPPTWIGFLHPPREDFAATMTQAEQAAWAAHWERLKTLYAGGSIVLVGPTLGRINTGVIVFEAPDEPAARRFLDEDPTVAGGFARAELRAIRISLLRGRD